ncbi:MAG: molybdopterin molybdotransferase MoeA [Sphingobium sp.]|nr:molybdopterin molybdotransferase MoeA [Sphingobium sp.]MCP5397754.1 molybdopterin molybdotransferase MoeA [Sphingomonas sp.]
MSLLPVAEAQSRLLDMASALHDESVPIAQAAGRWTSRPVIAARTQPALDLSAMDGYAIRFADMPGPWQVIGESAAGGAYESTVEPGQAVRIYTGAAVPQGADTVIVQEDVARDGDRLTLTGDGPGSMGRHIRKAGSDFGEGGEIIAAGTRLNAQHGALAALAGHGALPLPRMPRIALLSSGSELVPPGQQAGPHQIPASNGVMLQAMLGALPCEAIDLGIIPDDLDTLTACLADLTEHDIVVTTGGASVGDHDLVKPALEAAGGTIDFWKIAMRPGKPLISGRLGHALFLGLPGNPVSTFVTATLFLLPLVRKMAGCASPLPPVENAILGVDMPKAGGRDDYVRGAVNSGKVAPVYTQDSAATYALSLANCLIRRPAGSNAAQAGEMAEIIPL